MVLSVAPFRVIPPPSAVVSEGDATEPISIFLSSTVNVVLLIVVVVPLTVLFPVTVKFPATVISLDNLSPVTASSAIFVVHTLPSATWETVDLIDIW